MAKKFLFYYEYNNHDGDGGVSSKIVSAENESEAWDKFSEVSTEGDTSHEIIKEVTGKSADQIKKIRDGMKETYNKMDKRHGKYRKESVDKEHKMAKELSESIKQKLHKLLNESDEGNNWKITYKDANSKKVYSVVANTQKEAVAKSREMLNKDYSKTDFLRYRPVLWSVQKNNEKEVVVHTGSKGRAGAVGRMNINN